MKRLKFHLLLLILALAVALSGGARAQQPSATQVIELNPGWNLISIQVGAAIPLTTFVNSIPTSLVNGINQHPLIEVWNYVATGDPLLPGHWNTHQPTLATFPNDLATMQPGQGYWVNVGWFCKATLTGAPWDGAIVLGRGWNLIGFPGLARASSEAQDLSSIFGADFGRIPQVYGFDNSSAQRFIGYDTTAIPMLKDLTGIDPGRGYWVYALDAVTVTTGPVVILPGDADASPLQPQELFSAEDSRYHGAFGPPAATYVNKLVKFAGTGDAAFDLNANGILDDLYTQDNLKFDIGVDRKVIGVGNTGAGIINWTLANSVPWLFTAAVDEKLYPANLNRPKTASGVVSSESDKIVLYADRRGLVPGTQTATVTLYAGSVVKTITVKLDVPTASGDWKGYATTTRVNGKGIPLGAVDLSLNLFMLSDVTTETRFRAVLDREQSLLFPRDIFLNGVFYAGNDFSITTNFEMGPGDRNAPPYDTFPSANTFVDNPADPTQDKDYNRNGKLDPQNPFPFTLHRQVTLLGTRLNPDRMEGSYIESISGMLPGNLPIFIEGTFYLDRQSLAPTKKSVFNNTGTPTNKLIGGSSGNPYRDNTIVVNNPVVVAGVRVTLNIDYPAPANLVITLTSPSSSVVLHQNATTLATSYDLPNFNGQNGQGNWTLRVAWNPASGERGYFNGWTLNVQGLATYNATGKVTALGGGALAGTHYVLSGSNLILQGDTAANGTFSISGLTENNYTIAFTKPGYQSRNVSFFLSNQSVVVGALTDFSTGQKIGNANNDIELTPVSISDETLVAAPLTGSAPLNVNFDYLIRPTQFTNLGASPSTTWNFGDGTIAHDNDDQNLPPEQKDAIDLTGAKHIYTQPGTYTATATIAGPGGSIQRTSQQILVQRVAPDPAGAAYQLTNVSFIGTFAAPLNNPPPNQPPYEIANPGTLASYDISNDGNPPLVNVPRGTVYQETKRDTAAFDFDRFPYAAEAFQDTGYDDPAIPGVDFIGAGNGRFDFKDLNGNGIHDVGEPAEPFTDGNSNQRWDIIPASLHASAEDTDFFGEPYQYLEYPPGGGSVLHTSTPFATEIADNIFTLYQQPKVNNIEIPDRYRIITTMGGAVFGEQPSRVGDFVLQVGRWEP